MYVKTSYVCTTPLQSNSPSITVGDVGKPYFVEFIDNDTNTIIRKFYQNDFTKYFVYTGDRQWYTNWKINVYDENNTVLFSEQLNLENKVVFIKFDAYALGDNLAWIPYAREFKHKHNCHVIISTFWNDLFEKAYPDLLFVAPNTKIANVYAQYYIGTHNQVNLSYQPSLYLDNPLQKIASDILGLEYKEIKPEVYYEYTDEMKKFDELVGNKRYVTMSEYASLRIKEWNVPNGWQSLVHLFNSYDYEVVVISKEYSYLKNVINYSGDLPIQLRMYQLRKANYHIGLSTGLSWLAHAVGTHTFLISDFTPPYHEFQDNCTRIYNEQNIRQKISYEEVKNPVTIFDVIGKIKEKLPNI